MKRPPHEEDRERIGHMMEAIARLREAAGSATLEELREQRILVLAVERCFEIISEASRHVSSASKATEPNIAWSHIRDFGNVLRHGYDTIRFGLLYQGIHEDLPPLEAALHRMLTRLP